MMRLLLTFLIFASALFAAPPSRLPIPVRSPGGSSSTLNDNLVAHWKLDESSGTRNDSKGANHLTDNNTVTSAAGKLGDAADFESSNSERLTLADNADMSLGSNSDFTP